MGPATADLWDERGDELVSIDLPLLNLGGRKRFGGPVRTVRCFRDNALVKSVLTTPGNGQVLVVDGGGSTASALLGDLIAQAAVDNGWAGVVINGVVRDRVTLATLPLGIKALGSNPQKSAKAGVGELDVVLKLGGAAIRPGAMLYSDEDGIVVEL